MIPARTTGGDETVAYDTLIETIDQLLQNLPGL
jgi:hypothetical protein